MNKPSLISLLITPAQPWKNGGGTTRELLKDAEGRYRISVAEVTEDGAFSSFPKTQRWFAVLTGEGVHLNIDGVATSQTTASEPLCFEGAADTSCRLLEGATQDLNLMLHGVAGCMRLIRQAPYQSVLSHAMLLAIYAHKPARLTIGDLQTELPAQTLFYAELSKATAVRCKSELALWMEIHV